MSDGIHLSARIWMPETAESVPAAAILEYIPYRKRDMVRVRDERNHLVFAQHGFVSIRVDMRGSGDSEGHMEDMYGTQELSDAKEVIDWIASQPWCNGNVGMMGTSWGGTASLQATIDKPEGLKAIIAVCATDNRFEDDIHYIGGCVATDTVEWAATLPAILASPPDPKNLGERWREVWMERLERLTFPAENWLRHQKFDDYWQHGSVSQLDRKFDCPALLIGGWSDRYSNTVLNCLDRDPEKSWAIIGPWGHHYPDQASPGPGISFQKVAIRWWDHWLNGADNGVEEDPKLTVWVNEYNEPRDKIERRSGFWTSMQEWPIERKLEKLYLADATLQLEPTQSNLAKVIPVDLSVGCASGDTGYFGRTGGQPLNQREDDDRSLVFESPHIRDPFNLMGSVKVVLSVASDQRSSQISVRLCDVADDGTVALVAFAIRNLSLTDDLKEPRTFSPNREDLIEIKLPNKAYRFKAGHRLRVSISGSFWPVVWPSPKFANLVLGTARSHLEIPICRVKMMSNTHLPDVVDFGNENHVSIETPELDRWMDCRDDGGYRSDGWEQPKKVTRFPELGLIFGFETDADKTLFFSRTEDAFSDVTHCMEFDQDGLKIKVRGRADLASTEEEFLLRGKIEVEENGNLIFSRKWESEIPREYS